MPAHIFISYDHDDAMQVAGFRGLISNPNHKLDCHDRSLPEAVKDRTGRVIKWSATDPRSEPVRTAIRARFDSASRLVVLIGDNTHASTWVQWEIEEFFRRKHAIDGPAASRRIRGMRLKGTRGGDPPALAGRSLPTLDWDPGALDRWLGEPL